MNRRAFLRMTASTITAGALAGCMAHISSREPRVVSAKPGETMDVSAFHASRRYAETRFGNIAYVERGTSEAAALFLHGFPLNGFQWRGALDRLSPYRRCIAPDFLGLGYTQVAAGQSVAPPAQVEMLAALLDQLAISAVDLVANDSGGAIAQLFVTQYPQRVRTLMLTNCDVENDSPPAAVVPLIAQARAGRFADETLLPQLMDKHLARSAQGLGGQCYAYPDHPADETIECYLAPLLSSAARKAQTNAYALGLDPNPLAGIEPALKRCRVPTRIVWGTSDTLFSQASPDYLARTLPNSRGVRRVAGAKLFFPEEFPQLIAEEAQRLWEMA